LSENNPNSLANFIRIRKIELDTFILAVGLGKMNHVKKDGSVVYLKKEWRHLLNMYQLDY